MKYKVYTKYTVYNKDYTLILRLSQKASVEATDKETAKKGCREQISREWCGNVVVFNLQSATATRRKGK